MRGGGRFLPRCPGRASARSCRRIGRRTQYVCYQTVFQERELGRLADLLAEPFNELDYERRQGFFQKRDVDLKGTWDECYER